MKKLEAAIIVVLSLIDNHIDRLSENGIFVQDVLSLLKSEKVVRSNYTIANLVKKANILSEDFSVKQEKEAWKECSQKTVEKIRKLIEDYAFTAGEFSSVGALETDVSSLQELPSLDNVSVDVDSFKKPLFHNTKHVLSKDIVSPVALENLESMKQYIVKDNFSLENINTQQEEKTKQLFSKIKNRVSHVLRMNTTLPDFEKFQNETTYNLAKQAEQEHELYHDFVHRTSKFSESLQRKIGSVTDQITDMVSKEESLLELKESIDFEKRLLLEKEQLLSQKANIVNDSHVQSLISEMDTKLQLLRNEAQYIQSMKISLQETKERTSSELQIVTQTIRKMHQEKEMLEPVIIDLEQKKDVLQIQVDEQEKRLETLQSKYNELLGMYKELHRKIVDEESQQETAERHLEEQKAQLEKTFLSLEDMKADVEQRSKELYKKEQEVESFINQQTRELQHAYDVKVQQMQEQFAKQQEYIKEIEETVNQKERFLLEKERELRQREQSQSSFVARDSFSASLRNSQVEQENKMPRVGQHASSIMKKEKQVDVTSVISMVSTLVEVAQAESDVDLAKAQNTYKKITALYEELNEFEKRIVRKKIVSLYNVLRRKERGII